MGRAASKLPRKVTTRFNAENRAQSFIEKQKAHPLPRAPPKYESSSELLKEIEKRHPELKEMQNMKDTNLDERLKQVRIESYGKTPELKAIQKLPQDRSIVEDPAFGHLEPAVIPKGKLSTRQMMEGLEKSMVEPEYTYREFAVDYDLDEEQSRNLFHYFKPYLLYTDLPKDVKEEIRHLSVEERQALMGKPIAKPLKAGKVAEE